MPPSATAPSRAIRRRVGRSDFGSSSENWAKPSSETRTTQRSFAAGVAGSAWSPATADGPAIEVQRPTSQPSAMRIEPGRGIVIRGGVPRRWGERIGCGRRLMVVVLREMRSSGRGIVDFRDMGQGDGDRPTRHRSPRGDGVASCPLPRLPGRQPVRVAPSPVQAAPIVVPPDGPGNDSPATATATPARRRPAPCVAVARAVSVPARPPGAAARRPRPRAARPSLRRAQPTRPPARAPSRAPGPARS